MERIFEQKESTKLIKSVSGKYSYELKILGAPEDNLDRIRKLKDDFDTLISIKEVK